MYAKEAEIVNENFLAKENTYNLKVGGFGVPHFTAANSKEYAKKAAEKKRELWESDPVWAEQYRQNLSASLKGNQNFLGKKHSVETRKLMSDKAKERLSDPTKNSQYGTRWIHSLSEKRSKKISRTDPLPCGWIEGRKIKF